MSQLANYQSALRKALDISPKEFMSKAADPMNLAALNAEATSFEAANAFIDLVMDESVLLKNCRVFRTSKPAGEMTKLNITTHITESASENGTSTETRRPVNTSMEYHTKKTRSQFDITGEVEEDNIEGGGGRQTILNILLKAIANDMETLSIEGNEDLVGTDDLTRLAKTNDGFHVLTGATEGAHIVTAGNKRPSWRLFTDMLKAMPTKWRGDTSRLRWVMSPNTWLSIVEEGETKGTLLADGAWSGNVPGPLGIPALLVPKIPEDLALSGTASTGTFIWLTDPQNFVYIIQRDLKVEWERIARYDRSEMTAFMRTDFLVQEPDMVVKSVNVALDRALARYGA